MFCFVCVVLGVGSNLQDHLELYVQHECTQPITLYKAQKPLHMLKIGLQWLLTFTGDITLFLTTQGHKSTCLNILKYPYSAVSYVRSNISQCLQQRK